MRRPRALRRGDRVAVVAPASPFSRQEFDAGIGELQRLGFEPTYDDSVFARSGYVAGPAAARARALQSAWSDPAVRAVIAARGGYGSVHLLPLLDPASFRAAPKVFLGYSDNTTLLTWFTQRCGIVAFHGPMIEGRFAKGEAGYDRSTLERCICRPEPAGEITHERMEVLKSGEASGVLTGGTLTQLTASLGTPYAFDPPAGCVMFLEEVGERPYRLDRMLTHLRLSGVLSRAAALVFGSMTRCDEPGGSPVARAAIADVLADFDGPILYGLPSGHTDGPTMTLPFGVRAKVVTAPSPSLVIEEAAVE